MKVKGIVDRLVKGVPRFERELKFVLIFSRFESSF
jgi:hypothetical protein